MSALDTEVMPGDEGRGIAAIEPVPAGMTWYRPV
jgi:hypothetical protein